MAPPELQNLGSAAFLVLNLGDNTVGFGSSSALWMLSEALPLIVAERTRNPNLVIVYEGLASGLLVLGDMVPPELQNLGSQNAAFLVLNLGDNTVGFGSSSAFWMLSEALPLIAAERTHNPNLVGNVDSVSSSTEEEGSEVSENHKRVSKMKDPDWVPKKKVRKSCSLLR